MRTQVILEMSGVCETKTKGTLYSEGQVAILMLLDMDTRAGQISRWMVAGRIQVSHIGVGIYR